MKRLIAIVPALLPLLAIAHEGHGHFHTDDVRHYWLSPEHLIPIVLLGLLFVLLLFQAVKFARRKKVE
ncbi:MAG TPA: hypothetical protein PKC76_11055 [Saprospiraceae bacterium]|nr:hypothetical protein [Saprospiraceae bacterium]HMP24664.1 hypothetical protein [Saprospiraceae bacterium]